MCFTKPNWKGALFRLFSSALFYSGVLTLTRHISNRFQLHSRRPNSIGFPQIRRSIRRTVQVLAYHRVNDYQDPFFPAVTTSVFGKLMHYVATNYNVLPLQEAVERIQRNDVPDDALVVTFDDGYRDNYVHAFPILRDLAIPATVFLATDAIESQMVLWHDRVFHAFRESRCSALLNFGPEQKSYSLSGLGAKLSAQRAVLQFLWSLNDRDRGHWLNQLMEQLEIVEDAYPHEMLTWDEIRTMHQNGMTFGSHTASHPILSRLSPAQIRKEVSESKRVIENNLKVPVTTFAYPVGRRQDLNGTTKAILKETEYVCALTTIPGTNGYDADLFEMRRGGPWQSFLPTFALKLQWDKFSPQ